MNNRTTSFLSRYFTAILVCACVCLLVAKSCRFSPPAILRNGNCRLCIPVVENIYTLVAISFFFTTPEKTNHTSEKGNFFHNFVFNTSKVLINP